MTTYKIFNSIKDFKDFKISLKSIEDMPDYVIIDIRPSSTDNKPLKYPFYIYPTGDKSTRMRKHIKMMMKYSILYPKFEDGFKDIRNQGHDYVQCSALVQAIKYVKEL